MCGVTAIFRALDANITAEAVRAMTHDIEHRGPNDEGIVFFSHANDAWHVSSEAETDWRIALGSRRLSIQDVSTAGHMPMTYREKLWLAYNGEVYNFVEIRSQLEKLGHTFCSGSDTEVILAAYAEWGTESFARFRGMWGLILVDCARGQVILCRDRLGIKPLYLWRGQQILAVTSEIKQLQHLSAFVPAMNAASVAEYLSTGYENPNRSFFRDVQPVPAGTWIRIPLDTLLPSTPVDYWHPECIQVSVTQAQEASQLFAEKLRECVNIYLRSDVPVGCALSGGLDSSAIAALTTQLRKPTDGPLHTFTATFPGAAIDERCHVETLLPYLRAESHYVTPTADSFLDELNAFIRTHDEPVGSLSVYASYCVARLMRETGIPVTLNGQGGDEILSGYWQSYFFYLRQLGLHGHILALLNHLAGTLVGGNPLLLAQIPVMLKRYSARSRSASWLRLRKSLTVDTTSVLQKVLTLDERTWRVEEIRTMFLPRLLKWDDRNSMAFSVEGRYPFLDHELIELCLAFDSRTLYHHGWTKWPLRTGLRGVLPPHVLQRRTKFGFEVPQDTWLRGPLRPTLEAWLKGDRLLWNYVERADVQHLAQQTWQAQDKSAETGQMLFRLFMFDRWAEVFQATL